MALHTGGIIPHNFVNIISGDGGISLSGKKQQKPDYNNNKDYKSQEAFHVLHFTTNFVDS